MAVLESTVNEASSGENTQKMPETSQNKPKKLAEVIRLARKCAGNNKAVRDKAIKSIRNLFHSPSHSSGLTEESFYIIWKGLFYSMWMSDGLLYQENCAKNMASLLHWLLDVPTALTFFKCGMRTMINEWNGLDHFRLNKFMMFVRQLLRQALIVLRRKGYEAEHVKLFGKVLLETVLNPKEHKALGLTVHFVSIYLEELAKVSKGELKPTAFNGFILPCVTSMATCSEPRIISAMKKNVFAHLIKQSNVGLHYEEKYEAWRSLGFPGSIDQMERVELDEGDEEDQLDDPLPGVSGDKGGKDKKRKFKESDDDEEELDEEDANLDPRAGRVDVELPQIKFNAKDLIAMLNKHKFDKGSNSKSRKGISEVIGHLQKLSKGIYPFGQKKVREDYRDGADNVKKAVNRMVKFQKKIATAGSEGLKKKKKNKKRNRSEAAITEERNDEQQQNAEGQSEEGTEDDGDENSDDSGAEKRMRFEDVEQELLLQPLEQEEQTDATSSGANREVAKRKRRIADGDVVGDDPMSPPKVARHNQEPKNLVQAIFKRNSGMWVVTEGDEKASTSNPKVESRKRPKHKMAERKRVPQPAAGYIQLFPQSEWDRPLVEGEYEIFVPSKNYCRTKASTSTSAADVDDMAATLESSMKLGTPSPPTSAIREPSQQQPQRSSPKKVKFNTSLNMTQELEEHELQVVCSPAIPFDAKKKPTKTLLKKKSHTPVVNPWYRSFDKGAEDEEEEEDD